MNASFHLSKSEADLVCNADFFYTKHRITDKVYALFGRLSGIYADIVRNAPHVPAHISSVSPKIYKGENYRLLPYVMLDQPRYFKPEGTFAIRSLFWWGQSFSIHLVISGELLKIYLDGISQRISTLKLTGWHFAETADPWEHHFEQNNYTPLQPNESLQISGEKYFKLGRILPLDKWYDAEEFFTSSFREMLELLH